MKKFFSFFMIVLGSGTICHAQTMNASAGDDDRWSVGITEGYHSSSLNFSKLDYDTERLGSGLFGIFLQYDFGDNRQLAIRPELTYLNRGGKLLDMGYTFAAKPKIESETYYSLKSHYLDLRVPVIYQFGQHEGVRPYLFAAPILGFTMGGGIDLRQEFEDGSYMGYNLELNESNIAKVDFALSMGLGLKCPLYINHSLAYLGFEVGYEMGLSDTYSSDELDGDADVNRDYFKKKGIFGTRKMDGFEFMVSLSVPFSAFKSKKPQRVEPVYIINTPVERPAAEPEVEPQKECYELDEIIQMSYRKESIEGKTICAIDCVNFEYNKSTITSDSYSYLNKLALFLITSQKKMEVKGHTDNIGNHDFNMRLSKARAEAVVKYLVKKGVEADSLTYTYYGETRPLASNDTEDGRSRNRRVEFEIK